MGGTYTSVGKKATPTIRSTLYRCPCYARAVREVFEGRGETNPAPPTLQHVVYIPGPEVFGPLAQPLAAWTQRLGHRVVCEGRLRDQASLEVLPAGLGLSRPCSRWISVSPHRGPSLTRPSQAPEVALNGHHGLLDLAFCYAELLFGSRAAQRRYGRAFASLDVQIEPDQVPIAPLPAAPGAVHRGESMCAVPGGRGLHGAPTSAWRNPLRGRLLGISRCGAWLETSVPFERGQNVDLFIDEGALGDVPVRPMQLSGRILREDNGRGFVGLEFDFDQGEGLPSFRGLSRRMSSRATGTLLVH